MLQAGDNHVSCLIKTGLQVQTLLKSGPISEGLEFNMMCDLYFRYQKGLDIGIDGSQGVYELLKTDNRAYPLFKTD